MYKIVSSIFFVTALAIFSVTSAQNALRGGTAATWQVQKYDIDVTATADATRAIAVKAVLGVKNVSSQPATTLTLRISPSAEISSVRVNNTVVDFAKAQETIGAMGTLQRVAIRMPAAAPGSTINASVEYKLKISENMGLSSISVTSTSLLPLSFWYPTPNSWYFPKGADLAPLRIKVTAPPGQTVVSSGAET